MFGKRCNYQQVTETADAVYLQVLKNITSVKHMGGSHCFHKIPSDESRNLQHISSSMCFSQINTFNSKWLQCKTAFWIISF